MARERPVENPPPRSGLSSDEEEEDVNNEEENEDVKGDQNGTVDEEEEYEDEDGTDEDDDDEQEEKKPPAHMSTGVSDTPSKSDSASESVNDFAVQPIVSGPRRSIKFDQKEAGSSNRKGRAAEKAARISSEDGRSKKGSGAQRLWGEDDEIAILNGMIRYRIEKGADPYSDADAFHEYIKKSIQADVTKNQLIEKIRRLKKNYQVNVEKGVNGEEPVLSKAHDAETFELSKKIWGSNASQSGKVGVNSRGRLTLSLPSIEEVSVKEPRKRVSNGEPSEKYPYLRESLEMYPMPEGVKLVMRKELRKFEKSKVVELERKWKRLKLTQLVLFAQELELVREQTKLAMQFLRR